MKYLKLEMKNLAFSTLKPNSRGEVTHNMIITNNKNGVKPIKLKLKIEYKING